MDAVTSQLPEDLAEVVLGIADACRQIAEQLRGDSDGASSRRLGGENSFGDSQLRIDVSADQILMNVLTGKCAVCSSEEQAEEVPMGGVDMCVVFDPLDGSSIVETNFAVGTIFGIYRGRSLLGVRGRQQVAAGYALYGPRTDFIIATKPNDTYALHHLAWCQERWHMLKPLRLGAPRKLFAPANWRCSRENAAYKELVQGWLDKGYTLRYSGGMVPDVHHILVKGGGVFCSPRSQSHKPKLRLLYECAPLAFVMEAAGGASRGAVGSILDQDVTELEQTTVVGLGTVAAIDECVPALKYCSEQ